MTVPLLEIHDLAHPYGLHNINLTIPPHQIIGLVGPDGSGKTTFMRLIAALLTPGKGSIKVLGIDTVLQAEQIHAFSSYMPQKFGLYEDLTVIENLRLYAELRSLPKQEWETTFSHLFSFTGLKPFQKRLAGALSGGMKQKLGLACCLLKKPKLLILDEPSVGVDPLSRRDLWNMVQELLKEGTSVLWSTTYLDEAAKCNEIIFLNEGSLLYQGTAKEITKGEKNLENAFIKLLGGVPQEDPLLCQRAPVTEKNGSIAIEADHLVRKFGQFTAVNHISFQVKRGEIFGLLGPNGAGKSTTFKMLSGLLKPTKGTAKINEIDLQKDPTKARSQLGYMAQKFSLYGNLTVRQNLEFFSGIYPKGSSVEESLEIFDLKPYANQTADLLSLGFKQKLGLAAALLHWPDVLFLDEPTSGMDPVSRKIFWTQMKGLVRKGKTILISTHFMDEAENCNQIALIYHGELIHLGTPDELKAATKKENATLEDAFIQMIEEYDAKHSQA
jgi:ABC-2 type transport system ATP-binding protein